MPFVHPSFIRAVRIGVLACVVAAAGCAAPDDSAQEAQGLTVCHTPVVEGIDVYEGNGTINWNMVHASGREFGIARIADGLHHDSTFAANWAGMRAAGMIRGAYYFFRPTVDPNTMADTIRTDVGRLGPGDLPVTIDVECMCPYLSSGACGSATAGCVSPSALLPVLRTLSDRITADTGKVPMIYTGAWFWDGSAYLNGAANYGTHPLWVSGYLNGCVTVPSGWTDWRIWQYSDGTCTGCPVRGTMVPGVPSSPSVDRNRFAGTLADLRTFAGVGVAVDAGVDGGVDASVSDARATDGNATDADGDALVADGNASDARGDGNPSDARGDGSDGSADGGHVVNMGGCGCVVAARGRATGSFAGWIALAALARAARRRRAATTRRRPRVDCN